MAEKHLTVPDDLINQSTFSFRREGGDKEVFRITPDGVVIVQGDVYEAAKLFWDMVQELAPKGWKVVKEPQGKEVRRAKGRAATRRTSGVRKQRASLL